MDYSFYKENTESKSKSKFSGMTGVFAWMFFAILITGLVAVLLPFIIVAFGGNGDVWTAAMIVGAVGVVIFSLVSSLVLRKSNSKVVGITVFTLFSVCMGMFLSPLLYIFDVGTIGYALLSTSLVFGAMAIYGAVTKRDLNGFGTFLIMLLLGACIISLINLILAFLIPGISFGMMDWIISYVVLAVYIGFIAVDVQIVKRNAQYGELTTNRSLYLALNLYIDFVYVFIRLLALFGKNKN